MDDNTNSPAGQSTGTESAGVGLNLKAANVYTTFNVRSMPDIPANAQIIGICTIQEKEASPHEHSWIVADILAYKQLLFREGHKESQVWLSATDIAKVIQDCKAKYAHLDQVGRGGTHNSAMSSQSFESQVKGKDVSSATTGLPFQVHSSLDDLHEAFVDEIRKRAKLALENKTALVIIAMGLTNASQDLILGSSGQLITKDWITRVAGKQAPVILVTPAAFCSGWQVNAELGMKNDSVSDSTRKKLIVLSCKPTLVGSEPARIDSNHIGAIYLEEGSKDSLIHSFIFDSSCDNWEEFCAARIGAPLTYWQRKWETFPTVTVDNNHDGYSFLGGAFGGSKLTQLAHIKFLVNQDLQSCAGDWEVAFAATTKATLQQFLDTEDITEDQCKEVWNLVQNRASAIILGDIIRSVLGLPRPQGKDCRFWNYKIQKDVIASDALFRKGFQIAWSEIHDIWSITPKHGVSSKSSTDANHCRPMFYLATAVVTKFVNNDGDCNEKRIRDWIKVNLESALSMIDAAVDQNASKRKQLVEPKPDIVEKPVETAAKTGSDSKLAEQVNSPVRNLQHSRWSLEITPTATKEPAASDTAKQSTVPVDSSPEQKLVPTQVSELTTTESRAVQPAKEIIDDVVKDLMTVEKLGKKKGSLSTAVSAFDQKMRQASSSSKMIPSSAFTSDLSPDPVPSAALAHTPAFLAPTPALSVTAPALSTSASSSLVHAPASSTTMTPTPDKDDVMQNLPETLVDTSSAAKLSSIMAAEHFGTRGIMGQGRPGSWKSAAPVENPQPQKAKHEPVYDFSRSTAPETPKKGKITLSPVSTPSPKSNPPPDIVVQPPTPAPEATIQKGKSTRETNTSVAKQAESKQTATLGSMVDDMIHGNPALAGVSKEALATIFSTIADSLRQSSGGDGSSSH